MKLLSELRKKYNIKRPELVKLFSCNSLQAYDHIEKKANYYSIAQFLKTYEIFKDLTGNGAAEFIEKLKKEVK